MDEQHLPKDPIQWVKDLEITWQAMDAEKASEGYTEDAVMIFGCDQRLYDESVMQRSREWFKYATDLKISKHYIAHSHECIVASWESNYTDPITKKIINERGIEYFRF